MSLRLRELCRDDLQVLFEHQRDPEAARRAAFTPRELPAFLEHWETKILGDPAVCARGIVEGAALAGYLVTWWQSGQRLLGYWVGREFWGRGLASAALTEFLAEVEAHRPIDALVATSNRASLRVLEKCGFEPVPGSRVTGADGVEEVCYRRGR